MTRLARRVSLIAALSLFTSATTASAECAWVLWGAYGPGGAAAAGSVAPRTYRPMRAFTKEAACSEYELAWNKTQRRDGWIEYGLPPRHRRPARAEGEVSKLAIGDSHSHSLRTIATTRLR
jgi:hypothetical protein